MTKEIDYTGVIFTYKGIDRDLTLMFQHSNRYYFLNFLGGKISAIGVPRSKEFVNEMFKEGTWTKVGHMNDFVGAIVEVLREQERVNGTIK